MKKIILAMLVAASMAAPAALAQIAVREAWIRATVPSARSSALYLQITSKQDAQLVAVRTSVSATAEIHQMTMEGQMMRMHAVDTIALPAGKTVDLAAAGYHIMLMNLKRPLKEGETVPVTLVFRKPGKGSDNVALEVAVKPLTYHPH